MQVSALKTQDYELAGMRDAVREHFALLDVDRLFAPGTKVCLKPNLLMKRTPERATTTHPALVEAVIEHLHALGVEEITIADSPGGPYSAAMLSGIYEASGLAEVARKTGTTLNTSTGFRARPCAAEDPLCPSFNIIDPVLDADVVINLAKLKTHAMTGMSGGIKNLFGCVPGLQKPELHFRFPQADAFGHMLVELAQTVAPQLTIVDAVVAMEGDGPSAGTLRNCGWTCASRDVFVLDVALMDLIGLNVVQVPMIACAQQMGLAPGYAEGIEYLGDGRPADIEPFQLPQSCELDFSGDVPRFLRRPVAALAKKLSPRPAIRRRTCIGCGKCAESCPANTIDMTGKKARIDYSGCIKCYCCHEMCPVAAIDIKRFRLLSW